MEIVNDTPFLLTRAVHLDKSAAEILVVVLKATYAISEEGELSVAEEQAPVAPVDEFYGDPESSSIRQESELGPLKLGTDVFLRGSAVASRSGTTEVDVALQVGPVQERAVVFGDRRWLNNLGRPTPGMPAPFETMPLTWENAFGGRDLTPSDEGDFDHEPRNPVGRGFRAKHTRMSWEDDLLPNVEFLGRSLRSPGDQGIPVGFGPIGRNWDPRVRYRGTYDQTWVEERAPLLPRDFDERFHTAAPPNLAVPGFLEGGEAVGVWGCTRSGWLGFSLPTWEHECMVLVKGRVHELDLALNSVTVDTEAMELLLLWKAELRVHGDLLDVSHIGCRSREREGS